MKKLFSGPVVYHLLVFMLLVVPHSIYTNYIAKRDFELYLWNILVNDGLLLLVIYLNLYLLIPRFLQQKKYKWIDGLTVRTFHSFCYSILRNYGVNEFDNKFRIIGDEKKDVTGPS